jgi:NAD(P)-dependent dehydrogenase (short-subunit alcohol dehydrogenase family)
MSDQTGAGDAKRPVAFVTGASRGIGKATAIDLADAGFDVAVAARTMTDGDGRSDGVAIPGGLDTTAARIAEASVEAFPIVMNLMDRASVLAAVQQVYDHFGRIDVMVNNAVYQGPGGNALFLDLTEEMVHDVFEGNVFAQLAILHEVVPRMLAAGGGTIVNMISGTAYTDPPAKSGEGGWGMAYAMSKAAFGRVTPLLHVEHGAEGLRLFSIDPGFTLTERMVATSAGDQYTQHFTPATPDVIGRAIRWLCTDVGDPDGADGLRGQVVLAQREVKRRGLLPGWPSPAARD